MAAPNIAFAKTLTEDFARKQHPATDWLATCRGAELADARGDEIAAVKSGESGAITMARVAYKSIVNGRYCVFCINQAKVASSRLGV